MFAIEGSYTWSTAAFYVSALMLVRLLCAYMLVTRNGIQGGRGIWFRFGQL